MNYIKIIEFLHENLKHLTNKVLKLKLQIKETEKVIIDLLLPNP